MYEAEWRGLVAQCTPMGLRMQTFNTPNGQPPSGRGTDSDVAAAYFKVRTRPPLPAAFHSPSVPERLSRDAGLATEQEMEERDKAAVEAKNAPKEKTIDTSGDAEAEQWKADKAAVKAQQLVRRSAHPRPVPCGVQRSISCVRECLVSRLIFLEKRLRQLESLVSGAGSRVQVVWSRM